jgi:hypothetical protein
MQSPRPQGPGAWCSREIGISLVGDTFLYSVNHAPRQARPLGRDQQGLVPFGPIAQRIVQRLGLHLGIEEAGP